MSESASLSLRVSGMNCASCSARAEKALSDANGVSAAYVNFATGRATVHYASPATPKGLAEAVTAAGYPAEVMSEEGNRGQNSDESTQEIRRLAWSTIIAACLTLPVFITEMGGHAVPAFHHWLAAQFGTETIHLWQFILTTLVLIGPGRVFFRHGIPSLLRGAPEMNSLVAIGTLAAWGFSTISVFAPGLLPPGTANVYFEAAAVIVTLILAGRWMESRARGRAGAAIRALLDLQPKIARVITPDGIVERPVEALEPGDVVRVLPGETLPVDGEIIDGISFVDESMITGEPMPVRKDAGSLGIGGTLNGHGALRLLVTHVGADTALAQIIRMVGEAQGVKLPIQSLVNRITGWFVPAVILISILTFAAWYLFGPPPALGLALVYAVTVLIVACPCAMGLATPISIMVGTGRAAQLGVLFRRGDALQHLQRIRAVAFDKTGTLTIGEPQVTDIVTVDGLDTQQILPVAAAIEAQSDHPLAHALLDATELHGLDPLEADEVQVHAGEGISGRVEDQQVLVGNLRMMMSQNINLEPVAKEFETLAGAGKTCVFVACDGAIQALIAVADRVKAESAATISELKRQGLHVAMITGDAESAARHVADQVGITDVIAGVRPDGKVAAIEALQAKYGTLAFVGDGINDAPALATADVGLAIGSGTDVAVETADVVLMSGDLRVVATALDLSRRTMRNIRQNLFWAFAYNIALIPVAAGVFYSSFGLSLSPAIAALAMAFSSVFVVTNALRLRFIPAAMAESTAEIAPSRAVSVASTQH